MGVRRRDLSVLFTAKAVPDELASPLYFMTEDDISRGQSASNILTGKPFDPVDTPCHVESVIATLATGSNGAGELWKLNHYYERLDDWNEAHGMPKNPFAGPAAEPLFEMHNLTVDPEERTNLVGDAMTKDVLSQMQQILDSQRDEKRHLPAHRNPTS